MSDTVAWGDMTTTLYHTATPSKHPCPDGISHNSATKQKETKTKKKE